MGGCNSGRHDGRPTVDDALTLDVNLLIRLRLIRAGECSFGTLTWTHKMFRGDGPGTVVATSGYEASLLDPETASVRLHYTCDNAPRDYRLRLTATPCHYGGLRWWWLCPITGRRAMKLHLPAGATRFASRTAHQIGYAIQRQSRMRRLLCRSQRLFGKFGPGPILLAQGPPPRLKGMHQRTYMQLSTAYEAAENQVDSLWALLVDKWRAGLGDQVI